MSKTILFITNYFPPKAVIASRRIGCLAKYLSRLGHRVVVVCEKPGVRDVIDNNFVVDMPTNIEVHEIDSEKNKRLFSYFAKCKLSGFSKIIVKFILFWGLKSYLFYSDAKSLLKNLVNVNDFDLVFVSVPPFALFNSYTLGCFLKKNYDIPLVVDFRDFFGEIDVPFCYKIFDAVEYCYQKRTIKHADAIVSATEGISNLIRGLLQKKVITVTNGFDPDDLRKNNRHVSLSKFRIVYTGTIGYGCQSFRPLLDAIWNLNEKGLVCLSDFSIDFYGIFNEKLMTDFFIDHPCACMVKKYRPVEWEKCKEIQDSAALLLQNSYPPMPKKRSNLVLTGKLFDYLSAQRPILQVPSDDGIIADFLRRTKAGVAISNEVELQNYIKKVYDEWKASGTVSFLGDMGEINLYSRALQAEQMSKIFDAVAE